MKESPFLEDFSQYPHRRYSGAGSVLSLLRGAAPDLSEVEEEVWGRGEGEQEVGAVPAAVEGQRPGTQHHEAERPTPGVAGHGAPPQNRSALRNQQTRGPGRARVA